MESTPHHIFERQLTGFAQRIEAYLDQLLPEGAARAPRLVAAMRYALLAPGKRIRPFFVAESARLFGVAERSALQAGAALECVHCYSLIHDDLPAMDDDDLRRGRPTVHRAFDEATAILAGDALLTFAFEILGSAETHRDAQVRGELIAELARAAGKDGMAGGQMLDLQAESENVADLGRIITLQAMKTGALFRFACQASAILGQAGTAERAALTVYAERIGLAFQIADDILDVEASSATLGKATGKDKAAGKATFVDLLGLDGARAEAQKLVREAKDAMRLFGEKAAVFSAAADYVVGRQK
ncbi:polyprenyl synthetase family protein [Taklimakanibacter lacteus]|uniref:polyprenyl synthetase family protein n=1 Tax=Taklimakanibacter lacteus TaxID=2268456 RepID=UPI003F6888D2